MWAVPNGYPIPDPNPKFFSIPDPYPICFQNHRVFRVSGISENYIFDMENVVKELQDKPVVTVQKSNCLMFHWHIAGVDRWFLISLNNPLSKNIPHVESFWHFVICCICVFCICIFVFVRSTHGNIIFKILEQSSFQKYTTCWVFLALFHMLYFCICIFSVTRRSRSEGVSESLTHWVTT